MKNVILVFLSVLYLTACGGGSSSSGQSNVVSYCIGVTTETRAFVDKDITEQIFTNNCDFTVNLTTVVAIVAEPPVALAPNQEKRTIFTSTTNFIACRPPSIGIDSDDGTGVSLRCSE